MRGDVAITALATSFGFEVIAEGVETEAQLAILAGCGCLRYQGYLFAKPMSAEALEQFAVDRQPHPLLSQLIPQ
ncbi:EAL domain-containing protein [Microvirgula aerodenitrificans]|uniref:EAL domain-containing protein n=1 Tax=Microvirgula aerodenitrificans TaxID=57480 RepID=UPI0027E4F978|nr:EAL domain-containing protein [Microvirgula aerodenitrificans]